jgi:hypothetical protein
MLGGGFPAASVERGIALGADVIAVDGGSTDSGPHYLGTATAKTAWAAVARDLRIRRYGHDAILGNAEPDAAQPPREVGIVFLVTAADQATATQLAKFANPLLLHAPLDGEHSLPSFAFLGSPAETERGQIHEFVLQHSVDVTTPDELFRTVYSSVGT